MKYTAEGALCVFPQKIEMVLYVSLWRIPAWVFRRSHSRHCTKFSRSTALKTYTDGTGLGLYVGKNLIESQGGRIAESDGVERGRALL